ncbi:MAG TPA: NAD(P)H-binding protein [Kofleriaceae bacterium]|nr:NAD(P)H-binding protein [Kofleriaceae bacterium]
MALVQRRVDDSPIHRRLRVTLARARGPDQDWIFVRPGFMTSGKPRGKWRAADDGSIVGGMICRADVATFMLQQIESTQWLRRRPVVVW